jgi:nucleotide-binding universal stress UspA family protein
MTEGMQLTHSNYANIVVHVDISRAAPGRVELAGKLARRFGARLIGVASEEPFTAFLREGFVAPSEQVADGENAESPKISRRR